MDEEINIPTLIDEPSHFMIWQWDEILPVCVGLIIGLWLDSPMLGLGVGYFMKRSYVKVRDDKPRGYFFHVLRGMGFMSAKEGNHSMQQPLIDEYEA